MQWLLTLALASGQKGRSSDGGAKSIEKKKTPLPSGQDAGAGVREQESLVGLFELGKTAVSYAV